MKGIVLGATIANQAIQASSHRLNCKLLILADTFFAETLNFVSVAGRVWDWLCLVGSGLSSSQPSGLSGCLPWSGLERRSLPSCGVKSDGGLSERCERCETNNQHILLQLHLWSTPQIYSSHDHHPRLRRNFHHFHYFYSQVYQ